MSSLNRKASHIVRNIFKKENKVVNDTFNIGKDPFIAFFIKRYHLNEGEAFDLYVHCFSIFYEKIQRKHITKMTCEISSYLIQLGKFTLSNENRRKVKFISLDLISEIDHLKEYQPEVQQYEFSPTLLPFLLQLSSKCKDLFNLIFIKELSIQQIANLSEESEGTLRKRKTRCLSKLKELLIKGDARDGKK